MGPSFCGHLSQGFHGCDETPWSKALRFTIEGTQARPEPGEMSAACWPFLHGLYSLLSYGIWEGQRRSDLTHSGLGPSTSSLIKPVLHRLTWSPILPEAFSQLRFRPLRWLWITIFSQRGGWIWGSSPAMSRVSFLSLSLPEHPS